MTISLRGILSLIGWLTIVFGLANLARTEILSAPASWPTWISTDVLCALNLTFAIGAVLMSIGSTNSNRDFWIGASIVAVTLTVIQITDSFPSNAMEFSSRELLNWIISSANSKGAGSNWHESHVRQLTYLLKYSWTPILSSVGGMFLAARNKHNHIQQSPTTE